MTHGYLFSTRRSRRRSRSSRINLAEGNATVLIIGRHLLPLLNLRHTSAIDGFQRIGNSLTRLHIPQLEEGDGDETGTPETTDGFGDKPFRIGLSDDNDGLAGFGIKFIRSLCLEIVLDDAVNHGAAVTSAHFAHCGETRERVGRGKGLGRRVRMRMRMRMRLRGRMRRRILEQAIGETGVVGFFVVVVVVVAVVEVDERRAATAAARMETVSLVFADNLEKGHGHQPPGRRDQRIAGFVPVQGVLAADDVKEVALAEGEFLGVLGVGLVVTDGLDDLRGRKRDISERQENVKPSIGRERIKDRNRNGRMVIESQR